jgi:hypothetical protein
MCVLACAGVGVYFLRSRSKTSHPDKVVQEPDLRPASTDLVLQFGTQVTIEGKFFFQKYYTAQTTLRIKAAPLSCLSFCQIG